MINWLCHHKPVMMLQKQHISLWLWDQIAILCTFLSRKRFTHFIFREKRVTHFFCREINLRTSSGTFCVLNFGPLLSACVHELVRSEKERSFVLYTSKKHILLHSFWNVKRIYSEWRRLLLTSCICTVQPVWEMRIVHLNWTQICKCTSTGFISMKKFFWEKYCIKKVHRL